LCSASDEYELLSHTTNVGREAAVAGVATGSDYR